MNTLVRLMERLGAWRRRRTTRTLVGLSVVTVAAVAAAGVGVAAGMRGSPRPTTATTTASAGASGSPTPIDFQTVTASSTPTDAATASPSATAVPTPAPTAGTNTMTITDLVPQGIDADAGQQYCFSGAVGRLNVTQAGHDYTTSFSTQTGGQGTNTWQQIPMTVTQSGPLTYDLTPQGCVTWTKAETAGLIYTVFQSPTQSSPQASGDIELRVDGPGAPENGLRYVSESQSTLQEKAGVDSGFFSITANFSDLITAGDDDGYTYSADYGDGSGTQSASGKVTIQGDNIQALQGFDHTWQQAGTYTLTITLVDSDGGSAVANVTVTVSP